MTSVQDESRIGWTKQDQRVIGVSRASFSLLSCYCQRPRGQNPHAITNLICHLVFKSLLQFGADGLLWKEICCRV